MFFPQMDFKESYCMDTLKFTAPQECRTVFLLKKRVYDGEIYSYWDNFVRLQNVKNLDDSLVGTKKI
jgi:hypothetical protein